MQRVLETGPLNCKLAIIGEAPGAEELSKGEPFQGPSGNLLTKLLARALIPRSECYLDNVFQATDNKEGEIIRRLTVAKPDKIGAMAMSDFELFKENLFSRVDMTSAKVIIAVGNIALYALTGKWGIYKWRGSILPYGDRKIIPIIHPANILRGQYVANNFVIADLKRALQESTTPYVDPEIEDDFTLEPSFSEVLSFLARILEEKQPIGFDIEIQNEEVSCLSIATTASKCFSIPFLKSGSNYWSPDQETEIWRALALILESPSITKIGQNIIFDFHFIFRKYGIRMKNLEDTMIQMGIAYPDFPKGLDFITSIFTKRPYYKDEGKRWKYGSIPDVQFWRYNCKDSCVCVESFPKLMNVLSKQQNIKSYQRQRDLIEPLVYMQERGILVAVGDMKTRSDEITLEIKALTKDLEEIALKHGMSFINPNSTPQLKELFYVRMGLPAYTSRTTGAVTTDENALKRLDRKGIKAAKIVREIRKRVKLQGTYLEVALDEDDRIRSSMNPVGTKTGRFASSKNIFGTGTNMQNGPPEFNIFLKADPGYIIYGPDASQVENRFVAYVSNEPNMMKAFESGQDVHRLTASYIFRKDPKEISDDDECKLDPSRCATLGDGTRSERSWGKSANHGLNYGMGYRKAAMLWEIPENEAHFIVERYHQAYKAIRGSFHKRIEDLLRKNQPVFNVFGKSRIFRDRPGAEMLDAACSWVAQSSTADLINGAILRLYNDPEFRMAEFLNCIHDSIVFQVPLAISTDDHLDILMRLKEIIEAPIYYEDRKFSIPLELKAGFNMGELRKLKGSSREEILESLKHIMGE